MLRHPWGCMQSGPIARPRRTAPDAGCSRPPQALTDRSRQLWAATFEARSATTKTIAGIEAHRNPRLTGACSTHPACAVAPTARLPATRRGRLAPGASPGGSPSPQPRQAAVRDLPARRCVTGGIRHTRTLECGCSLRPICCWVAIRITSATLSCSLQIVVLGRHSAAESSRRSASGATL